MPNFRIVGPGRAGTALHLALLGAGWTSPDGRVLGRGDDLTEAAADVDLLVLAVPDAVVAQVAAIVRPQGDTVVAHMAGSLGLDVLAPHARPASIHPLVALPDGDVGARRLAAGAWFAVAGDPLARSVVAALGGQVVEVSDHARTTYHAAATTAANHLTALMGQVERLAAAAGLPLEPFLDLASGALDAVREVGPAAALTGPVSRGDWGTVARHLASIPPSETLAYQAMAEAARTLTGRSRPQPGDVIVVDTVAGFAKALESERMAGRRVGLVPTMGALHDGHASLIRRATAECDVVAVTVFVNPLQFAPTEDLSTYPRRFDADLDVAAAAGAAYVFAPSVTEMYGSGSTTTVTVEGPSAGLEGASRPTHFAGVATVVAKLFAMAGSCRAYFGEKDFQQLAVVRRMAANLSFPVEIVGCPIVREADGLAMSSRNVKLSPDQRSAAVVLSRALRVGVEAVGAGERDAAVVRQLIEDAVSSESLAVFDYAEVVDPADLTPVTTVAGEVRLVVAARFGTVRLIDNMGATPR